MIKNQSETSTAIIFFTKLKTAIQLIKQLHKKPASSIIISQQNKLRDITDKNPSDMQAVKLNIDGTSKVRPRFYQLCKCNDFVSCIAALTVFISCVNVIFLSAA